MNLRLIQKQFHISWMAVLLCSISILLGGTGIFIIDKILYSAVCLMVMFVSFYMKSYSPADHKHKIMILGFFLLVYTVLINILYLAFLVPVYLLILLMPDRNSIMVPDLYKDSPLVYGLTNMPKWKIVLALVFIVPVIAV